MFNKISRGIRRVLAIALSSVMVLSTPIVSLADITEEEIIVENVQEPASEITQELDTVDVAEEPATEEVMQAPVSDEIITSSEIEAEPGIIEVSSPSEVIEEAEEIAATPSEIILEDTAEDGMKITLKAAPDAFEYIEGLSLDVSVVSEKAAKEADEELESETKNDNIAKRVTYDIRVMHGGVEIEPREGKKVQVKFTMTDIPSGADSVNVYHIDEEDGVETIVDEAPVNEAATSEIEKAVAISNEDKSVQSAPEPASEYEEGESPEDGDVTDDVTIIGETGSFSLYTVDFTYKEKTISIPGDTTENLLSDILTEVGIEGEIAEAKAYQDASCSEISENGEVKDGDKVLFRVYQKDDEWYVDAVNAFHTEHGLTVKTAEGAEYIIKVTDDKVTDVANHTHGSWVYSADGAELTATCGNAACTLKDSKVSLTIQTKNKSYDGNEYSDATIDNIAVWEEAGLTVPNIFYYIKDGTTPLTEKPKAADMYTAKITVDDKTASCDFTIEQKSLTVTGTTADGKTYDGTITAVAHVGTVEGIIDADKGDVTVEIDNAKFLDKNFGNGKSVSISYKLTGTKAGNYATSDFGTTADIKKRNITLTSGSATKVYDGTPLVNKEVDVSGDGFASGEGAVYSVSGSQTKVGSSSNVFTYELNSNTELKNYSISTVEGVLTITEKPAPNPTPIPAPTPAKEENVIVPIKAGEISIGEAKVEGNKAIISNFTPEAVENLVTGKNVPETLTIDCSNTGSIITEVELDTANIQTVAKSNAKNLKVAMNSGSIVLDKGALTTVADKAENSAVVFGVERISDTKLNAKQKNAVNTELASRENANVFAIVDSYILANESRINDLEYGKATLEINSNFAPGTAEIVKNGNVGVYEISEDGTSKKVDSKTADGNIEFEVNNLTLSVILVD